MPRKKAVKKVVKKKVIKKAGKKRGPKPFKPDWNQVDQMLHIQCTGEEIAAILDVDYDTLQRACVRDKKVKFADYSAKKRQGGKASLRRKQWKIAETNPAMAIFLGKNLLGQKDKIEHAGDQDNPIIHRIERVIVKKPTD